MHGGGRLDGIKDLVDGVRRPLPFIWAARQVGLVNLDDIGIEMAHLFGQHLGDGVRQRGQVVVTVVDQRLGQHVRAGQGEFQRFGGQPHGAAAGFRQVKRTAGDRTVNNARRAAAEAHARLAAVIQQFLERHLGTDAAHGPGEVLDHPVGFGMVDVEAVKLAVAHHVDAGLLLGVQHDPRGIDQPLLGGVGG